MASDKTQYVVALIAEFANHFGLTTAQAVEYLSHPYKDFGKAFYLTSEKSQAMDIALARVDLSTNILTKN